MTTLIHSRRWHYLGWLVVLVVVAIVLKLVPYSFHASGEFRVMPIRQAEVRSEIDGLIQSVAVKEGDRVDADAIIATLATRTIQRDLDVARASLRRNREILANLEAGPRPEEIAVAEQTLQLANTSLEHSERALVRAEEVHANQHISDQEFEDAKRERDLDRDAVELAARNLALTRAGPTENVLEAQRAEVERLDVEIRYLEGEMDRTVLTTPISGRVTTLYFQDQVGRRVLPGDVVANVENAETVRLRVAVPEELMDGVQTGALVRARSWAHADAVFHGRVAVILPVAVTANEDLLQQAKREEQGGMNISGMTATDQRIVPVLVDLDPGAPDLISGLTGHAKIEAGTRSLGYALFHPMVRFVRVRVWSWLP